MDIVIRASVMYFLILILTRATGRRELAEMSAFELIVVVVMGDLIQQGVTQEDYSITGAILAIGTMALWSLVISYLGFRWTKVHVAAYGVPAVVFHQGEPVEEVLRTHRLQVGDLTDAAREQGIGDLSELEFAVLEPDGAFSFVRRDRAQSRPNEHKAD
ncbi:MAG: DUF421 domain-containing protein [Actinomycetota bacterium]